MGFEHIRNIALFADAEVTAIADPHGPSRELGQKAAGHEVQVFEDYREIRDDAVLIVNLILPGTADQRAADRAYNGAMMRGMAEGGYGPMHMGRAITVEGDLNYKQFVAVYYPGIDHMHAMIGSTFINRVGPGKQLGDTLAVATIPVLAKLDGVEA